MSTTVRDVLSQHVPGHVVYSRLAVNASLSKKPWTDTYPPILNPTVRASTYDSINQFLGLEQYLLPNPAISALYTTDASESGRLERHIHPLNSLSKVYIQQEGDTVRDFFQNIAFPVSLAWDGAFFQERSESGTPGPTHHNKTVDQLYSWTVAGSMESERCEVIGELKQHGVIEPDEWNGGKEKSNMTQRLGKEIRGYAYLYDCPQVFVYDSVHLLMVQFHAKNKEGIRSVNCTIDVCCVPRSSADPNMCTARYGLYRLVWRGWIRLIATKAENPAVSLGGFTREFEYWSGRPFWRDEVDRHKELNHPDGYYWMFDIASNQWYWNDGNGNFMALDTVPLSI